MKDLLVTYRLYLQTLSNIKDGNEVAGDRETLKILEEEFKKEGFEIEGQINRIKK